MKDAANKTRSFFYCTLVFTLICAILRTVSIFTAFDADVEYFRTDSLLPYLQNALMAVSVVFFGSVFFLIKKNTLPTELPENRTLSTFASLLCGFIYVISSAMLYVSASNTAGVSKVNVILNLAVVVTGLISAAYFICDALMAKSKGFTFKVISSMAIILNLLLSIVREHLDYTVAINTPNKTMIILCFVITALFIVQDVRFKVGTARPRFYLFTACTAALLCGSTSVSGIIGHYAKILNNSAYLVFYLLLLSFTVYIFTKIYTYSEFINYTANNVQIPTEAEPENIINNEEV